MWRKTGRARSAGVAAVTIRGSFIVSPFPLIYPEKGSLAVPRLSYLSPELSYSVELLRQEEKRSCLARGSKDSVVFNGIPKLRPQISGRPSSRSYFKQRQASAR